MKLENRSIKSLKKQADNLFSQYIRMKYMDSNGMVECVTCGHKKEFKKIQNGHYISRKYTNLRWDERNAHPQCYACNIMLRGASDEYAVFLKQTYGSDILEILNEMKHCPATPLTRETLFCIINTCKEKINILNEEGGTNGL